MNYTVKIVFDDGANSYDLPLVFSVSDPEPGMKATVIEGVRGDGSLVIPGGKRSQEIVIRGKLVETDDGYKDIVTLMTEMRTKVTKDIATLTMKHYDGGWIADWQYQVRRITPIEFPESLRTSSQEYEVRFLVLSF